MLISIFLNNLIYRNKTLRLILKQPEYLLEKFGEVSTTAVVFFELSILR